MALNIESALRLVAKVKGVGDVKKLEKAFVGVEKAAQGAAKGFKSVISSKAFQGMAVAATAVATGIALSAKAAIDFEDKMAGVLKVMEDMDTKGIKDLKKEILDLGSELPIAINGIADIYQAAGQSGVARDEMRAFALDVGRVATAFDITADEAGQAMANMRAALGLTQPEVALLFDAMNELGNRTAASSADLVEFMKRAAGSGKAAGLAAKETAALGAAMIETGVESRVAATALRSLVSALSKGSSATDAQVTALRKLGFAQIDATFNESELTREVEKQSKRRMDIARNETDEVIKQIRRRYDDQLTDIRRNMNDETEEIRKGLENQADIRIKELRERLLTADEVTKEAIELEIKAIREGLNTELKMLRRQEEDKLKTISRNLADREELELDAQERRMQALEQKEKEFRERQKEQIREQAAAMATVASEQLAQNLQVDAMATITDIFTRISQLPKSEAITAISNLMGEQASRGMIQLIGNMDRFHEVMGLVAEDSEFAGSTLEEFLKQMDTTASKVQLAQNSMTAFSIALGDEAATAIGELAKALTPLIKGFTALLTNTPGLTKIIVGLGVAFVGLTTAIPILASLKVGLAVLGFTASAFAVKFGLAIAGVVAVCAGLQFVWNRLVAWWNETVDAIGEITKGNLWGIWHAIEAQFNLVTLGLYGQIKRFVDWGLRQIMRIKNALFGAQEEQNANSGGETVTVSGYAKGGYVSKPKMALIGEGGQGEYVVPSNKISGFISNYQSGLRGQAAIPASTGGSMSSPNVNIKTGPVMQMSNGQQYVTVEDLEAALSAYTSTVFSNSRTAGGRRFQGIS